MKRLLSFKNRVSLKTVVFDKISLDTGKLLLQVTFKDFTSFVTCFKIFMGFVHASVTFVLEIQM